MIEALRGRFQIGRVIVVADRGMISQTKSTFEVRPIFHPRDDTSMGHIVACFLALVTEVRAVDLTLDGQRYRLRTDLRGSAYHAFAAAGGRPPAVVTPLGPAPTASPPPAAEPDVEVPA